MRRKLEFAMFYLFYVIAVLDMMAVLDPASCMVSCLLTDVIFVLYCWVRFSDDDMIHMFRSFIYGALLTAMCLGAFVKHSIVPFIFLGPVLLGYLRLEGGFRRAKVS